MADLAPITRQLRMHIERIDKVTGRDFADLVVRALEDIERRVVALERSRPFVSPRSSEE